MLRKGNLFILDNKKYEVIQKYNIYFDSSDNPVFYVRTSRFCPKDGHYLIDVFKIDKKNFHLFQKID